MSEFWQGYICGAGIVLVTVFATALTMFFGRARNHRTIATYQGYNGPAPAWRPKPPPARPPLAGKPIPKM